MLEFLIWELFLYKEGTIMEISYNTLIMGEVKEEDLKRYIESTNDPIDWELISMYVVLSEDFIREYQNKLNWTTLSICQMMSEEFIDEFSDKVNWRYIVSCQHISESFVKTHMDKISPYLKDLTPNPHISESFAEKVRMIYNL